MSKISAIFASMVFDDNVMKERLPKETYKAMKRRIKLGKSLEIGVANVVATAMKDWALERGVTHYTHWFQPMTGITAEKHDSFISPTSDGKVIMEFSGKELVRGEPDASSFPSGGLRATFEARGYTAWDPTSYAFIKEGVLCIPTAFCSYGGEALDKKTPLLRSMQAISTQAMRMVKLFGNDDVDEINVTVGPEQEYFLVDKKYYDQRKDLIYAGRTLFGAMPPKGQEMDDHYFGIIKSRVQAFMNELNEELWKLGILSKTEHNEVAPAQHELAPIFTTTNIATDHNQLTMELMQRIAKRHDMVCLLHEKPFDGVNGSGKHNNWSVSTDTGINLLEPGDTPAENAQFLVFLSAVIKAVDEYQDLLRISVATAGNDHRLGAHEAPPAVISIFLGDELNAILEAIESDAVYSAVEKVNMKIGVSVLPKIPKDSTDRNRTSPFAFTGNKFEFRMLGSASSIAGANFVLNTAVAEVLREFTEELEGKTGAAFNEAVHDLVKKTIVNHKRIIFNGNGYDENWLVEAKKRGLSNLKTTPDALATFLNKKNVDLFTAHGVLTECEMHSRYEIIMENYCKTINIEALTMVDMANRDFLPAITAYEKQISDEVVAKKIACPSANCAYETDVLLKLSNLTADIYTLAGELSATRLFAKGTHNATEEAFAFKEKVIPLMEKLRASVDQAELLVGNKAWPLPTYGELLFGV